MRWIHRGFTTLMRRHVGFVICASLSACGAKTGALSDDQSAATRAPGSDQDPASLRCVPLGSTPKLLFNAPDVAAYALLADDDSLWISGSDRKTQGPRLLRVTLTSGAATSIAAFGFGGGRVARWDQHVAYVIGTPSASGVALRHLVSEQLTPVNNPDGRNSAEGLVANATGVYWLARASGSSPRLAIVRRDVVGQVTVLTTLGNYTTLLSDAKEVFYTRIATTETTLEAVPIGGGPSRVIRRLGNAARSQTIVLVDETHVGYLDQSQGGHGVPGRGDLHLVRKDGSDDRVVLRDRAFSGFSFNGDPTWYDWVEQDDPSAVMRVRLRDGLIERIETGPQRWVSTITSDRCNVYWSVVNPPAVYGRARTP